MQKKLVLLFLMFSLLLIMSACQSEGSSTSILEQKSQDDEGVFLKEEVNDINIEIDESDWNNLVENAKDETYYSADVTINGQTITNVGVSSERI